jgi:hypothetical protein
MYEQFQSFFVLMVMAVLLRFDFEQNEPLVKPLENISVVADTRSIIECPNQLTISAQQKAWSEKAVKRYAEAQEKKWRNWNEAMFEAKKGEIGQSNF